MSDQKVTTTPVTRALDALAVPYRFFQHPGPVTSLEQAASERGQRPEQIIRSIVFRLPGDQFVMVLVAGAAQLSWPRLRQVLGTSRMSMASPEEVLQVTGYPTGAVSPFGLPAPLRILMDQNIYREAQISIGSGVRNTTVIMQCNDLLRALGPVEVGDYLQSETEAANNSE